MLGNNFTKDDYDELENALYEIRSMLNIMQGYCEYYADSIEVFPLLTLIKKIKAESKRITDKF